MYTGDQKQLKERSRKTEASVAHGGIASSLGHKTGRVVFGTLSDKFRRLACIWWAVWSI